MDTCEIAVLKWLREQPGALTITQIHVHFQSMTFPILKEVLKSLLARDNIEHGAPRGLKKGATTTGRRHVTQRTEFCGFGANDLRDVDGNFELVEPLSEVRYRAVGLLLRGQSPEDLKAFEAAVNDLRSRGYELTSLVVELRCPSGEVIPRKWICRVRPQLVAPPTKISRN